MLHYHNRPHKVLKYPHKVLQTATEPITDFTGAGLIQIIVKLQNTLQAQTWGDKLGMAAPQIGINKQVFIALGRVFVNPVIKTPRYKPLEERVEGCYSVPGRAFKTKRWRYFTATWQDHNGRFHTEKITGELAIVFQHEYDHLQGKCCIDTGVEIDTTMVQ